MKLLTHTALVSDESGRRHSLSAISRSVAELESYVRDVLGFARIESMTATPNYKKVHVQDVFQRLAVEFESVSGSRNVDLRFRATSAVIETDECILSRVLENIIGNAIKFTRHGVIVAARRHAGLWSIEVWDQGPGIPDESMERVFTSFYQRRGSDGRRRAGVGLGLAIVKRLAERLQYTIDVRSRIGRGSVFKVRVASSDLASVSIYLCSGEWKSRR